MNSFYNAIRTTLRGIGQVMFQQSAWTGFFFLAGIFWGSYECGTPNVAYGAIIGVLASTIAGFLVHGNNSDCEAGLWGFNGVLVGCAFPTFLANTWQMWVALVFCAMCTTWVRKGFNNVMAPWKVNSFTFPFVFLTWIFLLAARLSDGMPVESMSTPELPGAFVATGHLDFVDLVIYWLKGIAQVFLINSWVTGIFFLVGLACCSRWAAAWAAISSAIVVGLSVVFKFDGSDLANGLLGFSPVLTGICVGTVFYKPNWRSALWTVAAVIGTLFLQVAMDVCFAPIGLPTLTGPFCIGAWLFLLQHYTMDKPKIEETADATDWHKSDNK